MYISSVNKTIICDVNGYIGPFLTQPNLIYYANGSSTLYANQSIQHDYLYQTFALKVTKDKSS